MSNNRGQTLIIFALTSVLLGAMVVMTIAFGVRAKQKMELQAVADAAALTNATVTARTYNVAAMMNRAAVSHWVAMAGVSALHTYSTITGSYLSAYASAAYALQTPNAGCLCPPDWHDPKPHPPGIYDNATNCGSQCYEYGGPAAPGDCANRTWQTRDAFYNFIHAKYSMFNKGGGESDDATVGIDCYSPGSKTSCKDSQRAPGKPWDKAKQPGGIGDLDEEVADQMRSIRSAIHNLMSIQLQTWQQAEKVLNDQDLTAKILNRSLGKGYSTKDPAGFQVAGYLKKGQAIPGEKKGKKNHESWREVANTVTDESDAKIARKHQQVMAQAVRGTMGELFPLAMTNQKGDQIVPKSVKYLATRIEKNLNGHYGKDRFEFVLPGKVSKLVGCAAMTDGSANVGDCTTSQIDADSTLAMDDAMGTAKDKIKVVYKDGCTGKLRIKIAQVAANLHAKNAGSSHYGLNDGYGWIGGCHGNHAWWNANTTQDHNFGDQYGDKAPYGLNFIFASDKKNIGPLGAEGQPKIPVLLRRTPKTGKEPWDIVVPASIIRPGAADKLVIDGKEYHSNGPSSQAVVSNGIAYYHRQGHWNEPANLLNPYWRATLVPANIDGRPEHGDKVAFDKTDDMLKGSSEELAAKLYNSLRGLSPEFKGIQ